MVFKRRTPRSYGQMASDMIYPRGGWRRATTYVWHRLRRLPDQPHRVGRGIAAGVFISFTPLFGLHFLGAAAVGWLIRGNILAALLGTFVGNPVTIPFIAVASMTVGRRILGMHGDIGPRMIFGEFERAFVELWQNARALVGPADMYWAHLPDFARNVLLPYTLGGVILGTIAGVVAHYLTVPVIKAYHNRRARRMAQRIAELRGLPAAAEDSGDPPTAPATHDRPAQDRPAQDRPKPDTLPGPPGQ